MTAVIMVFVSHHNHIDYGCAEFISQLNELETKKKERKEATFANMGKLLMIDSGSSNTHLIFLSHREKYTFLSKRRNIQGH